MSRLQQPSLWASLRKGIKPVGLSQISASMKNNTEMRLKKGKNYKSFFVYNSSLGVSKQNLVKRQFPYIDTFDHEGPVVINAIRNLTVGVSEYLEIISPSDVDKRLAYTQHTLRGSTPKKYREILVTCKQLAKKLVGDEWNLGDMSRETKEYF